MSAFHFLGLHGPQQTPALTVLIYTVIKGYLESFCKWQSKENPEYWDKLSDHPDHWDHGLMLTGLDLYDGTKKQTSVIGKKANLKSQAMTWNRHTPNQLKNLEKN